MPNKLITAEKAAIEFKHLLISRKDARKVREILLKYGVEPIVPAIQSTGRKNLYSYEKVKKSIEKWNYNQRFNKKSSPDSLGMQSIDFRIYDTKKCPYPEIFESY